MRYTENMTKDGIYCSYLKCVCLSKEKYYKSQDEYFHAFYSPFVLFFFSSFCLEIFLVKQRT